MRMHILRPAPLSPPAHRHGCRDAHVITAQHQTGGVVVCGEDTGLASGGCGEDAGGSGEDAGGSGEGAGGCGWVRGGRGPAGDPGASPTCIFHATPSTPPALRILP